MKLNKQILIGAFTLMAFSGTAQTASTTPVAKMRTYLIEREIPKAGNFTPAELKNISQTSCSVLKTMGPSIEWIHSYVTGNKIVCLYRAENEALLREHAKKGGFPINTVTEVVTTISPETAK